MRTGLKISVVPTMPVVPTMWWRPLCAHCGDIVHWTTSPSRGKGCMVGCGVGDCGRGQHERSGRRLHACMHGLA
eukprot:332196-Chlamydomonas_euryale.AAC.1